MNVYFERGAILELGQTHRWKVIDKVGMVYTLLSMNDISHNIPWDAVSGAIDAWYKKLPRHMQECIRPVNIAEVAYPINEIGHNGVASEFIKSVARLPSVVDLIWPWNFGKLPEAIDFLTEGTRHPDKYIWISDKVKDCERRLAVDVNRKTIVDVGHTTSRALRVIINIDLSTTNIRVDTTEDGTTHIRVDF